MICGKELAGEEKARTDIEATGKNYLYCLKVLVKKRQGASACDFQRLINRKSNEGYAVYFRKV